MFALPRRVLFRKAKNLVPKLELQKTVYPQQKPFVSGRVKVNPVMFIPMSGDCYVDMSAARANATGGAKRSAGGTKTQHTIHRSFCVTLDRSLLLIYSGEDQSQGSCVTIMTTTTQRG